MAPIRHPSCTYQRGILLSYISRTIRCQTSCGADGKIIVWDVSEEEPTQVTSIDGIIPAVSDSEYAFVTWLTVARSKPLLDRQNGNTTVRQYGILRVNTSMLLHEPMVRCTVVFPLCSYLQCCYTELVTISSQNDWGKSSTFTDEAFSGAITALSLSVNGLYIATASKSGVFIWATHNRRLMYRCAFSLSGPLHFA